MNIPLSTRLRPQSLAEVAGQQHLIGEGRLLSTMLEKDCLRSMILYGPPGTGKSTIAHIICRATESEFITINAVLSNVKELREKILQGEQNKKKEKTTILFIDEIHRFNKSQQDALLPAIEEGNILLIGSTTHNPFFYITSALLSRLQPVQLKPLADSDLKNLALRCLQDEKGLGSYKIDLAGEVLGFLISSSAGDARKLIDSLELCFLNARLTENGVYKIDIETAQSAIQKKFLRYDSTEDQHYDFISAFIKSVRGTDPDAAIYYLARMLSAGEDPRFIARRLSILAAEDIGLADPQALNMAASALSVIDFIGMPEARIVLAECTLYLACAPKSNTAVVSIDKAMADIENGVLLSPPDHLISEKSAARSSGAVYKYPHDFPWHYAPQKYLSENRKYYVPGELGKEKEFKKRLEWIEKNLGK
ncbi:MAG: AAA family ATPase [Spirochaetes bacterium GWF1_41_5]|nr:MAG: AAA family ATPase [Spirochaetes bacterium GWF1_41_5]HBE02868.1 replication-associated recombination protein RarA [Spirochaetia bacterium]